MIRLGAIPTMGPFLMPSALPLCAPPGPMRIWLREELTDPLIDALRAGRLDLALMARLYDLGNLEAVPLFDDGYQFAVSADTPLHRSTPISPPALAGKCRCSCSNAGIASSDTPCRPFPRLRCTRTIPLQPPASPP